jgi:16S rRNA (guanine527-N7)-methyltransferase
MKEMLLSFISSLLNPYGVHGDEALCEKVRIYIDTLLTWNKNISLTTVTDPIEIVKFHFGESIFAASVVPMRIGRLADVGSGPGFPGIPLKMANQDLELTLIESNAKRCTFLSEVVRRLELSNVSVVHSRMEDLSAGVGVFDFITARAIGQHSEVLSWAKERLAMSGRLILWVGEDDADSLSRDPGWVWQPRALIPGSKKRYVLCGSPRP